MDTTTYWVCTPCIILAANGPDDETPDNALSLVPDFHHSSPGLVSSEHADPVECQAIADAGDDCGCETRTFVTRPCDGCGDHLAGERHALTVDDLPRGVLSVWADSFGVWRVRMDRDAPEVARAAIIHELTARGNGSEDYSRMTVVRTAHPPFSWREAWPTGKGTDAPADTADADAPTVRVVRCGYAFPDAPAHGPLECGYAVVTMTGQLTGEDADRLTAHRATHVLEG